MPKEGVFVLNSSLLDEGELGLSQEEGSIWNDFLTDASEIHIFRGLNLNENVFARAEPSELTATIYNSNIDPTMNDRIDPNSPVRLLVEVDSEWETLFTGTLRNLKVTYDKETHDPTVSITAYDLVHKLVNKQTYVLNEETFAERMATLATAAGTTITVDGGTVDLAPKETPVPIWDLFNIAANSEGGVVYPNRQGTLEAIGRDGTPRTPVIEFADTHGEFDDHFSEEFALYNPLHSCYTKIDIAYDTTAVANSLSIRNISTVDAEGNDVEEDLGTYEDNDSVIQYGEAAQSITTNLVDVGDVDALVTQVFSNFATPKRRVNSITYRPDQYWQTLVDVGDSVSVVFHNSNWDTVIDETFMVVGVDHDITPERWETTLNLFKEVN